MLIEGDGTLIYLLIELMTHLLVIYIGHHMAKWTCKCVTMRASLPTSSSVLIACMHISICACNTLALFLGFPFHLGYHKLTRKDAVAMVDAQ